MSPPEKSPPAGGSAPTGQVAAQAQSLAPLPGQPRDEDGPVFAAPWQAQAFALVVKLHEAGSFTWKEWTETLGAELAEAAKGGQPDDGSRYYEYWLAALERLVKAKGLLDSGTLRLRRDEWERAYRATPHGKPVLLGAAGKAPAPSAGPPRRAERRD